MNFYRGDTVEVRGYPGIWTVHNVDILRGEAIVTDGTINICAKFHDMHLKIAINSAQGQYDPAVYYYPPIKGNYTINGNAGNAANGWLGNYAPGKIEWNLDPVSLREEPAKRVPECECGSHKTYGTNCSSDMHSTWCKLYSKAST